MNSNLILQRPEPETSGSVPADATHLRERRRAFYERHGRRPLEDRVGIRLWYADDGTIVDRFGRSLAQVRAAETLALELAVRSRMLAEDVETSVQADRLILDQIAGDRFLNRLHYDAHLLENIAKREGEIERVLAEAEREEAMT